MKLEKIHAPSSKAGIFSIYKQHGSEAVIYRTNETPNGVEILYGLPDYAYENEDASSDSAESTEQKPSGIELFKYQPDGQLPEKSVSGQMELLNNRIGELNQMFVYMNEYHIKNNSKSEPKALWTSILTAMGFPLGFCDKYFSETSLESMWFKKLTKTKVIKEIKKVLLPLNVSCPFKEGVYTFIGATGVGKTTTLLKMAKYFRKIYDTKDIGIITLDKEESTTKNSLGYYSNSLKIPFELVTSLEEFKDTLYRMKKKKVILIDTQGINPNNNNDIQEINTYLKAIRRPHINALVVSCGQNTQIIQDMTEQLKQLYLDEIVLTKQDELSKMGNVINSIMSVKLPIRYICNGKNVDKDIYQFNSDSLIDQLLTKRVTK